MNKESNEQQINNLVAMLDDLMSHGSGRVNVNVDGDGSHASVQTTNSTECSIGKGACAQPTELSLDDE